MPETLKKQFKEMADIFRNSYKTYPREYVFTAIKKPYPPISRSAFSHQIQATFKRHLNVEAGANILRDSYATYTRDNIHLPP